MDFRGYTTSRGVALKKMKSYEQYRRRRWIYIFFLKRTEETGINAERWQRGIREEGGKRGAKV